MWMSNSTDNLPNANEILEFIQKLAPQDEIYPRQLMNLFSQYFGYGKLMFFPCMKEPIYRENQIRWAALSNAVIMNIDSSAMRRYSEHYFRLDIFAPSNITPEQRQMKFVRIKDIMPYERFEQTEYFKFLISIGCRYQSDLILKSPDGRILAYLAFFCTEEEGDFTDEQAELFSMLSDYISPLYYNSVCTSTHVSVYKMLDLMMGELAVGAALLDNRSMLLWANQKALEYGREFVHSEKDLILKNVFFIGEEQVPLQQLINEAGLRFLNERTLKLNSKLSGTFSFYSQSFPVQNVTGTTENRILIFIVKDDDEKNLVMSQVMMLLTTREREVLDLICLGISNKEIADQLNISLYTLRTHIANIYKKLGVDNKAALLVRMNRK